MYICQLCGKEWKDQDAADNEFTCTRKCGGMLKEKKEDIARKSLFISYGRDQYAYVAERLNEDLSARGYPVWFDKNKLKEGEDWEEYIEKGILMATQDRTRGRVVFIVTPHSARKPEGYCLNELAMALMRGAKIIPVMLVESEVPLSIARIQYLDIRDCLAAGGQINEEIYQKHLKRLMEAIDHDRLDYEGVQAKLINALEPLEFSVDILFLLQNFTGRHWIINDIERWIYGEKTSRVFWLTGSPGVGKSAISAWLRERQRVVKAFHFCLHNDDKKKSPINLVKSVAYQLATQIPAYMEKLGAMDVSGIVREYPDAGTLFKALIVEPLHKDIPAPDEPVVILIDGLDEATVNKRNRIAEFIRDEFYKTPEWLKLFITSRPEEPELNSVLSSIVPYRLDGHSRENLEDIREYLRNGLKNELKKTADPDDIIKKIIEKSEGVFLYATWVVKDVLEKRLNLDRVDEFPVGLAGVYARYFERVYPEVTEYQKFAQSVLGIILAAYEPLKISLIAEIAGCREIEIMNFRKALGSLFTERENGIEICHRSISDWLLHEKYSGHYSVSAVDGRRAIIENGLSKYRKNKIADYYLEFLPLHLMENGEEAKSADLLTDFDFTMKRIKAGHLERVLSDYRTMGNMAEKDIREKMKYWTAFFREKAHILRRGNEEWPAYKIFLQLAIEHADDSPLTTGAEKFLADGKCDWLWLRREQRVAHAGIDPCIAVFEGHTVPVIGALVLTSGRILSWSADHTLRLWDDNGQPLAVLEGHTGEVNGVLALPGGRILSWSEDRTLRLWDENGQPLVVLEGHTDWVDGALALSDGRILSWSGDRHLRLWDDNGQPLVVLEGHTDWVDGALALSDGRILSWSGDRTIRLWDDKGQPLVVLEGHTGKVGGALALPDGCILSWSGDPTPWSSDHTLRLWDDKGQPLAVLEGHMDLVIGALALPDGRVISWSRDQTLRLWDDKGQPLAVMEGHTNSVLGALALSDGSILSWSFDRTLRLWDDKGQPLVVLEGHTDWVDGALALSDGRILSWSGDRTLRLWDREGEPLGLYNEEDAIRYFPEYRPWRMGFSNAFGESVQNSAILRVFHEQKPLRVYWQAASRPDVKRPEPNGRLIVMQDNGQVCILWLYKGNSRINLDEEEESIGLERHDQVEYSRFKAQQELHLPPEYNSFKEKETLAAILDRRLPADEGLRWAIRKGYAQVVDLACKMGADLCKDTSGLLPVEYAYGKDRLDLMQLLFPDPWPDEPIQRFRFARALYSYHSKKGNKDLLLGFCKEMLSAAKEMVQKDGETSLSMEAYESIICVALTVGDMNLCAECLEKYDAIDPEAQFYNHACLSARLGSVDDAFQWLEKHILKEEKPDFEGIQKDTDLESLRADPRWAGKFSEWQRVKQLKHKNG